MSGMRGDADAQILGQERVRERSYKVQRREKEAKDARWMRKLFFGLRLRCLRALVFADRPTLKHHFSMSLTHSLQFAWSLCDFPKEREGSPFSRLFLPLLCFYFMILVIQRHLCFICALSISFPRLKVLRRVVFRRGRLLFHLFLVVVNQEKMWSSILLWIAENDGRKGRGDGEGEGDGALFQVCKQANSQSHTRSRLVFEILILGTNVLSLIIDQF